LPVHLPGGDVGDALVRSQQHTIGADSSRWRVFIGQFEQVVQDLLGDHVVRRGGTISLIGVYGGMADPLPMLTLFDKPIQLRMGQANVKRWVDDIMPLLDDDDPLGVDSFASHVVPLDEAPHAYDIFQKKQDGAVKVMLKP
jgi:threonine dehydrogenase-like Zn-dependent dehydrogenase